MHEGIIISFSLGNCTFGSANKNTVFKKIQLQSFQPASLLAGVKSRLEWRSLEHHPHRLGAAILTVLPQDRTGRLKGK